MNSYTLTELTAYLEESTGWFSPTLHARYIPVALDDLIKAADTDHIGVWKEVVLPVKNGQFELPWDNVGSRFSIDGRTYQSDEARTGRRSMNVQCRTLQGEHGVGYTGLDVDSQGQPCLPGVCLAAFSAALEYIVKRINRDAWGTPRASLPSRPSPQEVENLRVQAILEADALRGAVNMRSPESVRQAVAAQTAHTLPLR